VPKRKRVLRIAHLTDVHLQPEGSSAAGFVRCLKAVHLTRRPDLILNGGDSVHDIWSSQLLDVR